MKKYASFQVISAALAEPGAPLLRTAHRAVFEYEPRMGFLYVRSRAISSRANDNFDEFPALEIEAAWRSFIGKPVFVNHHNDNHRRARGVIIDAALHSDTNPDGTPDTWVEVLMEVDAVRFPKLAQAILAGEIERTSMGVDVAESVCSFCGNRAATPLSYCAHIPRLKGKRIRRVTGSGQREDVLVTEICTGLHFFENSLLVEDPADPTAYFLGVDARGLERTASRHTADTPERKTREQADAEYEAWLESLSDEEREELGRERGDAGKPTRRTGSLVMADLLKDVQDIMRFPDKAQVAKVMGVIWEARHHDDPAIRAIGEQLHEQYVVNKQRVAGLPAEWDDLAEIDPELTAHVLKHRYPGAFDPSCPFCAEEEAEEDGTDHDWMSSRFGNPDYGVMAKRGNLFTAEQDAAGIPDGSKLDPNAENLFRVIIDGTPFMETPYAADVKRLQEIANDRGNVDFEVEYIGPERRATPREASRLHGQARTALRKTAAAVIVDLDVEVSNTSGYGQKWVNKLDITPGEASDFEYAIDQVEDVVKAIIEQGKKDGWFSDRRQFSIEITPTRYDLGVGHVTGSQAYNFKAGEPVSRDDIRDLLADLDLEAEAMDFFGSRRTASHFYPHAFGQVDGKWYWIVYSGDPNGWYEGEYNGGWDDGEPLYKGGPFDTEDEASEDMRAEQGNPGMSVGGVVDDPQFIADLAKAKGRGYFGAKTASVFTVPAYYVMGTVGPIAGPYSSPSAAAQAQIEVSGSGVQYLTSSDASGKSAAEDFPHPMGDAGEFFPSSLDPVMTKRAAIALNPCRYCDQPLTYVEKYPGEMRDGIPRGWRWVSEIDGSETCPDGHRHQPPAEVLDPVMDLGMDYEGKVAHADIWDRCPGCGKNTMLVWRDSHDREIGECTQCHYMQKALVEARKVGYNETLAPAAVDTMRDDACPVCGEAEAYSGDECAVCGYIKPPDMFCDPDVDKAKALDLRQDQLPAASETPVGAVDPAADAAGVSKLNGQPRPSEAVPGAEAGPEAFAAPGTPGATPPPGQAPAADATTPVPDQAADDEPTDPAEDDETAEAPDGDSSKSTEKDDDEDEDDDPKKKAPFPPKKSANLFTAGPIDGDRNMLRAPKNREDHWANDYKRDHGIMPPDFGGAKPKHYELAEDGSYQDCDVETDSGRCKGIKGHLGPHSS